MQQLFLLAVLVSFLTTNHSLVVSNYNILNYNISNCNISLGYKTIQLIEDKADVYLHLTTIKKWDICAPQAILTNMGGRVRTRTNHEIDFGDVQDTKAFGFIAALNNFNFYWDTFKIDKTN
jgi:3'-phosphoadenosine 5'-phosphosulfate (PAPS) 3'-phosphatase